MAEDVLLAGRESTKITLKLAGVRGVCDAASINEENLSMESVLVEWTSMVPHDSSCSTLAHRLREYERERI